MKKIQPYYPQILKKLKSSGATISLDTNWDPSEKWDSGIKHILQYVDVFLPNQNEAMAIAETNNLEEAIDILKSKIPIIALKRGKDGGTVYSGCEVYDAAAIDVPKVDAIGAGDSFNGGFIYGYLNGLNLGLCLQIGCICGSMNTRAEGGIKAQARLNEVRQYIAI